MTKALAKNVTIDLDEDASQALETIVDEDGPVVLGSTKDSDVVDENANPLDTLPEDALRNSDGTVTLPLHFPVTVRTKKDGKIKEKVYQDLVFHRLVGADQRAIAAVSEEHTTVVTFSRSTRINQAIMNAIFDKMDLADVARAGRVLNHFLTSGPRTGR
ncbi:hypothetical protein [Rhizobium sp.]|uniref:hypothetical protein n=1 Tax=Rhizobium sp. TaxID=391 RepID=UPI003F7F07DA